MTVLAFGKKRLDANAENASKILKVPLTVRRLRPLDGGRRLRAFSRAMNGLNHICGICREIIR
jgi:hypothetical protein